MEREAEQEGRIMHYGSKLGRGSGDRGVGIGIKSEGGGTPI